MLTQVDSANRQVDIVLDLPRDLPVVMKSPHRWVGEVLEFQFGALTETRPELLAHHLSEAEV